MDHFSSVVDTFGCLTLSLSVVLFKLRPKLRSLQLSVLFKLRPKLRSLQLSISFQYLTIIPHLRKFGLRPLTITLGETRLSSI